MKKIINHRRNLVIHPPSVRAVPFWLPMLGLAAWLALATGTRATVIPFVTNATSGVALLADSFENQTLGPGFPTTANMNPAVSGASWWTGSSDPTKMFTTTEQAFRSSQSLKITRTSGTFTRLDGLYTSQASGTLDVNLMVYVPGPVTNPLPNILLFSNWNPNYDAANASYVGMAAADNPATPGNAFDSFALFVGMGPAYGAGTPSYFTYSTDLWNAFKTNTWQHWEIIHTIGTSNATFIIDGVSATWTSPQATVSFSGLEFSGTGPGPGAYYIDAVFVPEPSTALLLGTGLAILTWRRRRRR